MATLDDAMQALNDREHVEFPRVTQNSDEDTITVFFDDSFFRTEVIDEILTIHYAVSSGDIVGCRLEGVSRLAEHAVNIFNVADNNIELRFLLLSATGNREVARHYYDLSKQAEEIMVPVPSARAA